MEFILQKEQDIDMDVLILKNELDNSLIHTYRFMSLDESKKYYSRKPIRQLKQCIPVGTLEFVQNYLHRVYNINCMNPIEIPVILRIDKFLGRKYRIVTRKEIPQKGNYFVKYVSKLKVFSYSGSMENLFSDNYYQRLMPDGLYQVSELLEISAEYRCFVYEDKIVAVNYYDGDCCVFPDILAVNDMINTYAKDDTRPKSYTMDVAIIKKNNILQTVLLEVHPWVSVGLYGYMFGSCLPYCYRDGLYYYIESNKPISKWECNA